ncbi:MAG: helix-turn-helix domain-containing protein [Caulobacter sp.]|nr:helix-turn-helix domain-containing protein [Caulobacter sp.]
MTPPPDGPRPPRQKRSEETLGRILKGAQAVLAQQDLDEISVEDIARQAGVSVGAIYTRFKSKEDLLAHLLDDIQRRQVEQLTVILAPDRWRGVLLDARLDWLVDRLQASARAQPGLLRAVFTRLLSQSLQMNAGPAALNAATVALISDWLLAADDGVTAPDPAIAAATTAGWLSYSVQMAMLYTFAFPGREADAVTQELKRAALAALRPSA